MKNNTQKINTLLYQAKNGAIELRGDFEHENIWATQADITALFDTERSVITKHIRNIFKDKELNEKSVCAIFAHTASDGKTYDTQFYNIDVIISVGYRVNSKTATEFRKWATKILKDHITKGYTINKKQVAKHYDAFVKSIADIQTLLPKNITFNPKDVLELIKEFASTWVSLDAYDKEKLSVIGTTKKAIKLSGLELATALMKLRGELIEKNEATDIFAQERKMGSIEGIVGNVMQSFNGKNVYQTVEEKAAHLLYFIVKGHPFVDGNKRSGAFAFIWFLRKTKAKTARTMNAGALTVLTLLVAEGDPRKKDQMIALITQILK